MIRQDYCEEFDIYSVNFGESKYCHSVEILDGKVVVDFDKDDNVIGFEMFDFHKECIKGQEKINKLFKDAKVNQKKKKKKG